MNNKLKKSIMPPTLLCQKKKNLSKSKCSVVHLRNINWVKITLFLKSTSNIDHVVSEKTKNLAASLPCPATWDLSLVII